MKPGHVEIFLLLIAFSSVCLGGLNSSWWIYFMSADLDVMAYALYAMCLVLPVSVFVDVELPSCNYNIHNFLRFSASFSY